MSRIRALIADDQELVAAGIEIILRSHGKEFISVVGIARNGKEAVRMADLHRPDVVLLDVRMPEMDGVKATRIIHDRHPAMKILILTTFDDDQYVFDALGYGALGYVLKNGPPDELVASIRAVHGGNLFVSPSVACKLVQHAQKGLQVSARPSIEDHGRLNYTLSCFETLSTREAEILHLLLRDLDNREIAEGLFIAEQTVKNHISSIYAKLGVVDRIHAKRLVKERLWGRGGSGRAGGV